MFAFVGILVAAIAVLVTRQTRQIREYQNRAWQSGTVFPYGATIDSGTSDPSAAWTDSSGPGWSDGGGHHHPGHHHHTHDSGSTSGCGGGSGSSCGGGSSSSCGGGSSSSCGGGSSSSCGGGS
ncbi:hypothetical protein ACFYTF_04290 [Nocardia thailandica]|uniref:TIGR04222 domain-containing membrane protein n=1 Tax=Nocardia thailandica TaxID=257275 RepID=A0ABW6PI04_9NOCA